MHGRCNSGGYAIFLQFACPFEAIKDSFHLKPIGEEIFGRDEPT